VNRDGRDTSYHYDGLGRQASTTDTTDYGSDTTHAVFNGTNPVQQSDNLHGTSTLVQDAAGNLAEHVTANGAATWDLLDGLGSTIAGAQGGSITQLVSYSDWGTQDFATDGWSAPLNYTGEAQDPTQSLVHNFARSYDPGTGSWTAPDTWDGLITAPRSLARYAYVADNPTTYTDPDGHLCARVSPGNDAIPLGCGSRPTHPVNTKPPVTNPRPVPQNPPGPVPAFPTKPTPKTPTDESRAQARHILDQISVLSGWISVALNTLGAASILLGFLGPEGFAAGAVLGKYLGILAVIASLVSTASYCFAHDWNNKCWAGVIYAAGGIASTAFAPPFVSNLVSGVLGLIWSLTP
jgi:RHS repeat-associated protein